MEIFEVWRFKSIESGQLIELAGQYDLTLVVLSIVIASMAAYSALIILERVWAGSYQKNLQLWLGLGAIILGAGVWAMHFTGMLAFVLPVAMNLDTTITIVSILPPIVGSYVALRVLSHRVFTFFWIQIAALVFALGVGSMHFIGMEAMQMTAYMHYEFWLFVGSILVAHVLATVALYVRVVIDTQEGSGATLRLLSAALIGAAISGMHYTAMASVSFFRRVDATPELVVQTQQSMVSPALIFIAAVFFAILTLLATIVSKRLQAAENTSKEVEAREQAIIETLADALIVITENGHISEFNSACTLMFLQRAENMGNIRIEQLMQGVSWEELVRDVEASQFKIIGQTIELEGLRSDGERFPVEVRFSLMPVAEVISFNAVIRDITKRKRLEEQLLQSQKLESIGQLAAGIAHEINTPTQYISDNTNFLKKALPKLLLAAHTAKAYLDGLPLDATDENLQQAKSALDSANIDFLEAEIPIALDQSLDGLSRVSKIVSAMKSFSHASDGEKKNIDLKEAIETTVTVAKSEWKYVAEVECHFDDSVPLVPCLRDELNQVFLSIIVNAAHAIEESRDEYSMELGKIIITTFMLGDWVEINIVDNGSGMPESVRERIFDPFFTTKEVGKGTGQGLSIAFSIIVDKHQGELSVMSQEGEGTTFCIRLPLNDEADEAQDESQNGGWA